MRYLRYLPMTVPGKEKSKRKIGKGLDNLMWNGYNIVYDFENFRILGVEVFFVAVP